MVSSIRIALTCLAAAAVSPAYAAQVRIQSDANLDAAARHGLSKLKEALIASGHTIADDSSRAEPDIEILAGMSSGSVAAPALRSASVALPSRPQGLVIKRINTGGRPSVVLCGTDSRGLMYAAFDLADRLRWAKGSDDPLQFVRDVSESPFLVERGISMYTMQRAYFESRLYDENYWKRYFDLLANSRINAFTVIFGYENGGFLAPPYPYFFDTPGYDNIRMVGLDHDLQERNSKAFKALIRLAHERGIDVTAAIWDHIYRGGVQGGGIPGASEQAGKAVGVLVTGLTADNLSAYTKAALRRFMQVFPEIDALEFRMHTESGLKREEMGPFWHDVFALLKEANPKIRVTLRAKDVPNSIIDDALAQHLNVRMETKFWMEQMGPPFHPTHINRENQQERRHGYADLLRYPQQYRVLWRLWSGGTTRLLLWSDPEYVRRYAMSARLYDGDSIDVNEMLATKMLGEPHDKQPMPILNARYRSYDYEFERYWPFYRVWGRVSYNPETPSEVWEKEYERRFGAAGRDLMNAVQLASQVLPRIVAAAYRYQMFPTTRGWAEMMRQDDLPRFAELEGTDIEQFMSPKDEARSLLEHTDTSKRRPEETSRWFAGIADRILDDAARASSHEESLGSEGRAALADVKILAWLARYYAARLPAAVNYNLFTQSKNPGALDAAIEGEKQAVSAWQGVVDAAGDVYSDDLAFGVHAVGFPRHWREELERLQQGLHPLMAQREAFAGTVVTMPSSQGKAHPGQPYLISLRAEHPSGIRSVRLRYRHLNQTEDYATMVMQKDPNTGSYSAEIPGQFIAPGWDLMFFVEVIDNTGYGRNYPDLETTVPYVIIPVEHKF